jgi:hypothetical protein
MKKLAKNIAVAANIGGVNDFIYDMCVPHFAKSSLANSVEAAPMADGFRQQLYK